MKIIDAHIHTSFDSVLLKEGADFSKVDYSPQGLKKEMQENEVEYAVSMGMNSDKEILLDQGANTPMIDNFQDNSIIRVGGINPYKADWNSLFKIEKALAADKIRGIKIYLGYYPKYAYDDAYKGFYELAAIHDVPVIFHTGDTYDKNAKVKFAHPLTIDEVAVDFKDTKFIIAHIGNPWTIDAGEVIYKNHNVYGDLSGLFVGGDDVMDKMPDRHLDNIIKAYQWVNDPKKFLYGSDWPIVSMKAYIALIQRILKESTYPEEYEKQVEMVFELNAKNLFKIK